MISRFWLLKAPRTQPLAEETPGTKSERIICPAYDGHRRGGKRLGDLSVIVHPRGAKDFTWTWLNDLLVLPRVIELFDKYRVTGFEAKRAKVSYPKSIKASPPDMFELVVTGWGGFAAPAAGVTLVKWCPACEHKNYAIAEPSRLIDPAAWDGSDLFIVWPLPGYRFASDRLAGILRQERVTGIDLLPAPKLPTKRGAHVGPGTLTTSMPEHRARELDQRFGVSHWLVEEHQSCSFSTKHL
jgi:hypothetical protein